MPRKPRATTPPWHLWGTSQALSVAAGPLGSFATTNVSQQLARIDYGRPDSFKWMFSARILSANDAALAGEIGRVLVTWQVTLGIGRSSVILPLDTYLFEWGPGPAATVPTGIIFSSTADGPLRAPASVETNVIDTLVADGLQCEARIAYSTNIVGATRAVVELSAHFAPITHVRPDWYMNGVHETEQFPGGETGGR